MRARGSVYVRAMKYMQCFHVSARPALAAGSWNALLASVLLLLVAFSATAEYRNEPPGVIFDTDVWSDIDDIMALAVLHSLQSRGEARILAVTSSMEDDSCASYIDLLNTYYGRGSIPVGVVHGGVTPEDFRKWLMASYPKLSASTDDVPYTRYFSALQGTDGRLVYPHRIGKGSRPESAVPLLRRVLAQQPDSSVLVVQVGFSTNLARLLDSKPDAASPLGGRALVERKVKLLSLMAGNYGESIMDGKTLPAGSPEFNVILDVPAAQKLYREWPTPIVASGFEIGMAIRIPGERIDSDFRYTDHHPVSDSYRRKDKIYKKSMPAKDPTKLHDHAAFDLTSALYAVRPEHGYFSLSKPGTISVLPDGGTRFTESPEGRHLYLIVSPEQKIKTLEALVDLIGQPPSK